MSGTMRGFLLGFMLGLFVIYGADWYRAALFH